MARGMFETISTVHAGAYNKYILLSSGNNAMCEEKVFCVFKPSDGQSRVERKRPAGERQPHWRSSSRNLNVRGLPNSIREALSVQILRKDAVSHMDLA
jgi:hypothetical protein